jgi:hypothetical protein
MQFTLIIPFLDIVGELNPQKRQHFITNKILAINIQKPHYTHFSQTTT